MRILITGGKGQLGRALSSVLKDDDVLAPGRQDLDVTHENAVRRVIAGFRPQAVIHAAAWTDTAACERDPEKALALNAGAARNVAAACRQAGAAMVYVSTNEVFDGEKGGAPYAEDDPPDPVNQYGRSKLEGERAVREVLPDHCIVRTSWLYGPGRNSFPEKILDAGREQGRLKLVTDEIASPTWTSDLAEGIAELVRRGASGVYHLTNGGACSRKEWAEEVLRLAGLRVPVEPVTQAEFGAPYRKPVDSRLANVRAARLGIELRPWREALADHMAYLQSQAASPAGGAEIKG